MSVISFVSDLFTSKGLKRKIVAWLSTLVEFLLALPVLPPSLYGSIKILNQAIQILGGVAVTHAAVSKTLDKSVILSLAAAVNGLIFVSTFFPPLLIIVPTLIKISLFLSPLAAGTTLAKNTK